MSAMSFREPNEVKWVGVRPAHKGTQIFKDATAENGITVIHTVSSGKTLYLCEVMLRCIYNVTGWGQLYVQDNNDIFVRDLCLINPIANTIKPTDHNHFWPPVEIPSAYDICVQSNAAGLIARGAIFGWEE